ncbi:hypothetical protein AX27061_1912 [Achromobacter xylosoxidans NBRC 15126 = ATCC 27061]|nr:hypothetical protein AX27061_1912 [Achromobacter xylosoxidans NBRC 15126 = ATCC 27061]
MRRKANSKRTGAPGKRRGARLARSPIHMDRGAREAPYIYIDREDCAIGTRAHNAIYIERRGVGQVREQGTEGPRAACVPTSCKIHQSFCVRRVTVENSVL